jgi:hypothetical protein
VARLEPGEGIGCLVISPEDVVELKAIEFILQLPNIPPVCNHAGVVIV